MERVGASSSNDARPFRELCEEREIKAMALRVAGVVSGNISLFMQDCAELCAELRDRTVEYIDPTRKFTHGLLRIPQEQRAEFTFLVLPVVARRLDESGKRAFINAVRESNDYTLGKNLHPLITQEMCSEENIEIIRFIERMFLGGKGEVIKNAARLMNPATPANAKLRFLQAFILFTAKEEDLDLLTGFSLRLVTSNMCDADRNWIVQIMVGTPPDRREAIVRIVAICFLDDKNPKNAFSRVSMINCLRSIPAKELNIMADFASDPNNIREVTGILWPSPDICSADELLKSHHHQPVFIKVLRTLASIPANERASVVDKFFQILGNNRFTLSDEKASILSDIGDVPSDRREKAFANALQFFTVRMVRYNKRELLKAFAEIPADGQDHVAALVRGIIPPQRKIEAWCVISIIGAIFSIPEHLRDEVARLAALQFPPEKSQAFAGAIILQIGKGLAKKGIGTVA